MATRQLPRRLLVVFLVLPCLMFAQVSIKEKVEIQPKLKSSQRIASSSASDLAYIRIADRPNDIFQAIIIQRPCSLIIDGTMWSAEPIHDGLCIGGYAPPMNYDFDRCGDAISCTLTSGYSCGGYINVNASSTQSSTTAHIHVDGVYNCMAAHPIPVYFDVYVQVIPHDDQLGSVGLSANPTRLVSINHAAQSSELGVDMFTEQGGYFQYCGTTGYTLSIENPIDGVTLVSNDGLNTSGTSLQGTCSFPGSALATLQWDGRDIPNGEDTVNLRLEILGMTVTQSVTLRQSSLDHYIFSVSPDTMEYENEAMLSAVAVDKDNNEVEIPWNTEISLTATPFDC